MIYQNTGHTEVVGILIDHGADYNVTFPNGYTMLQYAAEFGNCFIHLLSKNVIFYVRVYVALFSGQSIWLLYNFNLGDAFVAKNLIENGDDIFKKNIFGRTPLLQAARNGNCFNSYSCVLCDFLKRFLWRTSHAWGLVIIDWYNLVILIMFKPQWFDALCFEFIYLIFWRFDYIFNIKGTLRCFEYSLNTTQILMIRITMVEHHFSTQPFLVILLNAQVLNQE